MMKPGRYGEYGGQYVPETLMNALLELEADYMKFSQAPEFKAELKALLEG